MSESDRQYAPGFEPLVTRVSDRKPAPCEATRLVASEEPAATATGKVTVLRRHLRICKANGVRLWAAARAALGRAS